MPVPSSRRMASRPLAHGRVVDEAEAPDLAPEKKILRHRQIRGEQDLLVNENDALRFPASTGPENVTGWPFR